ncbi:MAG: DUF1592 domain-containing protein [Verrucomicrobiales bacterium]|nr:DUF1592 domain-containing protein [Verrucomicrobiales bacterium]
MRSPYPRSLFLILLLTQCFVSAGFVAALDLENHPGKAIYQKQCLECHGETGEGAEDVDADPLVGDRTLESLAGRIERTMPEDNEDDCVGPDAKAVAEYIFHAFYSPAAQAKLNAVTTDITRLTRPQYLNSLADIMGYFRDSHNPPEIDKPGLNATYYASGRFRVDKELAGKDTFKRVDKKVHFDFKSGIPKVPEDKTFIPEEFAMQWDGSIMIEETGVYEFVIRTRNGVFLNLNSYDTNNDNPKVIDGWVAPNNEIRDESAKMFLLGGRRYPLAMRYFKFKADKGYVELLWKKPGGILETIPEKVLTTNWSHPVFTSTAQFPADDRSYGYERGSSVSRQWLDAVTDGAYEAAEYVVENLKDLAKVKKDDPERGKKLREFGAQFPSVAFRRPLKPEEKSLFVDKAFEKHGETDEAIRRIVLLSLTSPRFLYPDTAFDSPTGPWARASTMALALWDSIPNRNLRKAAEQGKLSNAKQVEEKAWQMLHDGRARNKTREFFHHWLELDKAQQVSKDSELFPDFSPEVMADLRTSLELFLDEITWSEKSDYRELLLSDKMFLNERLGKIYGKPEIKGSFQKADLPGQARTGVITHPYLMTAFAYHNNTSPIHRGVFLTRNIAGMTLKPPPEAIEFKDNDFPPHLSMREKVTELTRAKACMACHSMINPLGFSLEHYDAIGRWRAKEEDKPINDDGILETDSGERIEIKGPREVAEFAANSESSHRAFVRQMFHHSVKQPALAYGPETMNQLQQHFQNTNFNIRYLLVKIATLATRPETPKS